MTRREFGCHGGVCREGAQASHAALVPGGTCEVRWLTRSPPELCLGGGL